MQLHFILFVRHCDAAVGTVDIRQYWSFLLFHLCFFFFFFWSEAPFRQDYHYRWRWGMKYSLRSAVIELIIPDSHCDHWEIKAHGESRRRSWQIPWRGPLKRRGKNIKRVKTCTPSLRHSPLKSKHTYSVLLTVHEDILISDVHHRRMSQNPLRNHWDELQNVPVNHGAWTFLRK